MAQILKKLLRAIPGGLLALQLVLPLCHGIALVAGMEFTVYNIEVYAIVSTVLMAAGVTVLFLWEAGQGAFYLLIPPATLLGGYTWLTGESDVAVYLAVLNVLAACALLFRRGRKWKYVTGILCCLLASLLLVIGSARCFFYGWVEYTPVQQFPSPDGHYTAQIVNRQSLHDSDKMVRIQNCRRQADVLFGKFETPEKQIRELEWDSAEAMTVQWHDADTLLINGKYYDLEDLP